MGSPLQGMITNPKLLPESKSERCTLLVGLCASGKSTYAKRHLHGRPLYEDISHLWKHPHLFDGRFGKFLDDVQQGRPWIADAFELCDPQKRQEFCDLFRAQGKDPASIEWIYFTNTPGQCVENAKNHDHRGPGHEPICNRLNAKMALIYVIPDGAEVRDVYGSKVAH